MSDFSLFDKIDPREIKFSSEVQTPQHFPSKTAPPEGNESFIPKSPNLQQARFLMNLINPAIQLHLYVGGAGSGKTQALCQGVYSAAIECPGNIIGVVRKNKIDLKHTTWAEFVESVHPSLIKEKHEQEKEIELYTNDPRYTTKILFRGLDDRERWGGQKFGQIFIDEANECDPRDFTYLQTRLRHRLPREADISQTFYCNKVTGGMIRFIALIFNPPSQADHWLRSLWIDSELFGRPVKRTVVVTSTYDNAKNLDKEYIELMEQNLPPAERQRMMDGKPTIGIVGKPCTPAFSEIDHTFSEVFPTRKINWLRGWDFGWRHPCVAWLEITTEDEVAYLWNVNFDSDKSLRDFVRDKIHPSEHRFVGLYEDIIDHQHARQHTDKSNETSKSILRSLGYSPRSRFSGPKERAELINELFRQKRLFIHETCTIAIDAFNGGWHKSEDGEEPNKDGYYEHFADAIGYALWYKFGKLTHHQRKVEVSDPEGFILRDFKPKDFKTSKIERFSLPGMGR